MNIGKPDGNLTQHNPLLQLNNFGINPSNFRSISGKVLDVGCGKNANLVKLLLKNKIDCEGIDGVVQDNSFYLMKNLITALSPNEGCIPRADGIYDLVLAHMNYTLYSSTQGFYESVKLLTTSNPKYKSDEQTLDDDFKQNKKDAMVIVEEALRVLDKDFGKFVCFPAIEPVCNDYADRIDKLGFEVRHEPTNTFPSEDLTGIHKIMNEDIVRRTIFYVKDE